MDDNDPRPWLRREFMTSVAAVGGAGAMGLAGCATTEATSPGSRGSQPVVAPGNTVLFQGDSITDAGRSRDAEAPPNRQPTLGNGYAWLTASGLLVGPPGADPTIYNRGISGNKVFQLADRWEDDCLALQPDVISILIGVNDIWHARAGNYDGTVDVYERDYDALLSRTRAALPNVRLVICEPFVLRCGAVDDSWFPEFDTYREAAQRVAARHDATWVAFQAMFDEAVEYAPPDHWARDGVHPSGAGAALMAQTWLRAIVSA
jgi:lysophospholipase L1-like esterase